jgi:hypothetical protein
VVLPALSGIDRHERSVDMSDLRDEQTGAENLDGDKIDPTGYPPDEPLGLPDLEGRDVSAVGEYAPDSVRERTARQEPDFGEPGAPVGADRPVIRPIEPDDPFGPDETGEAIADLPETSGQLDGPVLSEAEDARSPGDQLPAEEAAVHLTDPDGGPGPADEMR